MASTRKVVFYVALALLVLLCGNIVTINEEKATNLEKLLKRKGFSLLHQNIRGLLVNFHGIQELLSSNQNIDVLTLSETHISTDERIDKLYKIPGYNFERRNRAVGKGGG